jgi:hypothetical protein
LDLSVERFGACVIPPSFDCSTEGLELDLVGVVGHRCKGVQLGGRAEIAGNGDESKADVFLVVHQRLAPHLRVGQAVEHAEDGAHDDAEHHGGDHDLDEGEALLAAAATDCGSQGHDVFPEEHTVKEA